MRKICGSSKTRADRVVDRPRRGQVVADRLLEHHPRRAVTRPMLAEALADRPEQRGCARPGRTPGCRPRTGDEHVGDGHVVAGLGQVDADEPQPCQEPVDGVGVEQVGGDESAQFSADFVAVAGVVEIGPGHGDDSGVGGQLAVPVAQVQRRQQLAQGEVAGAAEDHEVAGVNAVRWQVSGHAAHGRETSDASQTDLGT